MFHDSLGYRGPEMNKKVKLLYVDQGCPTQISMRARSQGPKCLNVGLGGQIKGFRGSHLARGPHAVHACYRWFYEQITMVNYKRSQNINKDCYFHQLFAFETICTLENWE